MRDIKDNGIAIFDFPSNEEEEDEELVAENEELKRLLPFSVVGSETEVVVNGRRVRCRAYPWVSPTSQEKTREMVYECRAMLKWIM